MIDALAAYLAEGFGCTRVLEHRVGLGAEGLERAVLVCRLRDLDSHETTRSLQALLHDLVRAPVAIVACVREGDAPVPAALEGCLRRHRFPAPFVGQTREPLTRGARPVTLAVLENLECPPLVAAPPSFRAAAIVPTYNEADIIVSTLEYLVNQGLEPIVVDNWSTDRTVELVRRFARDSPVSLQRFPPEGPSTTYDLVRLMTRVEAIASTLDVDWCVLYDADERRRAPWDGLRLIDGIFHVDRCGFNCIDHVTVEFWPVHDGFDPAIDVERQLDHFEISSHPGHYHQRRGWKRSEERVALAPSAGHDVAFSGRRVYPFKFLLKHYPIRSQAHGERKLQERRARWSPRERAWGWHAQYDEIHARRFVRDPTGLTRFDAGTFAHDFLVERLTGLGVFAEPPSWATPPR